MLSRKFQLQINYQN